METSGPSRRLPGLVGSDERIGVEPPRDILVGFGQIEISDVSVTNSRRMLDVLVAGVGLDGSPDIAISNARQIEP